MECKGGSSGVGAADRCGAMAPGVDNVERLLVHLVRLLLLLPLLLLLQLLALELLRLELPLVLVNLGTKRQEGRTHTGLEGCSTRGAAPVFVPLKLLRSQHLPILVQGGTRGEGEAWHKRSEGWEMEGFDLSSRFFSLT